MAAATSTGSEQTRSYSYRDALRAQLAIWLPHSFPTDLFGCIMDYAAQPKLIVAGGATGASGSPFVECYDPFTREWINLSDLPHARIRPQLYCGATHVYALGGSTNLNLPRAAPDEQFWVTQIDSYDIRTGVWATAPLLTPAVGRALLDAGIVSAGVAPTESGGFRPLYSPLNGTVIGDNWYWLGALYGGGVGSAVGGGAAPPPQNPIAAAAAALPARAPDATQRAIAVADESGYFGDVKDERTVAAAPPPAGGVRVPNLIRYHITSGKADLLPPPRMFRSDSALAAMHNRLYVFGGRLCSDWAAPVLPSFEYFDLETKEWNTEALPLLPHRSVVSAVAVAVPDWNRIYLIAGREVPTDEHSRDVFYVERKTAKPPAYAKQLTAKIAIATAAAAAAAAVTVDTAIAALPPTAASGTTPAASAAVPNVAGIDIKSDAASDSTAVFDPYVSDEYVWSGSAPVTQLPAVPTSVAAVAVGGTIYVLATEPDYKTLWLYSVATNTWLEVRGMPHYRLSVGVAAWHG